MKKIDAAQFRASCLTILDRLGPDGVVVTKHGRPVARVLAMRESPADLIGVLKGRLTIKGDLLEPAWSDDALGR